MSESEERASYLTARDPSLIPFGRALTGASKKNLFSLYEEEEESPDGHGNLLVYLRLKPSSHKPEDAHFAYTSTVLTAQAPKDSTTYKNRPVGGLKTNFTFTQIFGPEVSQKELFDKSVHKLFNEFFKGTDCLLFAYGTTNAGKTYTIQGNISEPGVVPRSVHMLFNNLRGRLHSSCEFKPECATSVIRLSQEQCEQEMQHKRYILGCVYEKSVGSSQFSEDSLSSDFVSTSYQEIQSRLTDPQILDLTLIDKLRFSVWVSFVEIYNENIYDLLQAAPTCNYRRKNLQLGQDLNGHAYVRGLTQVCVNTGDEAYQVLMFGKQNLQFATTALNTSSSRSHCIFSIKLVRFSDTRSPSIASVNTFSFCDLAGTERLKKTLNCGDRLRESQNINTSLHVLGRCLDAIRTNHHSRAKCMIPFRDSKLTRLFQHALLGKGSLVSMIVNINPAAELFDETLNVLKFSAVATQVVLQQRHRRKKHPPRQSRFSRYVSQSSFLSSNDNTTAASISSSIGDSSLAQECQVETLLKMIDTLKAELQAECKRSEMLEINLREELTNYFWKMITEVETQWKKNLEEMEAGHTELAQWRLDRVENYYKEKLRKRRRVTDDGDADDESFSASSPSHREGRLQKEVDLLQQQLEAAQKGLHTVYEQQNKLALENSALKFDLATAQKSLAASEKTLEATLSKAGTSTLTNELRDQLKSAQAELHKKDTQIKELTDTLKDAADDFKLLANEADDKDRCMEELENKLAQAEETVRDKDRQLEECYLLSLRPDTTEQAVSTEDLEESRIAELKLDLDKVTTKLKDLETSNTDLQQEASILQKENKSLIQMRTELQSKLTEKEKEVENLEKEIKKMIKQMDFQKEKFRKEKTDCEDSIQSLRSENERLKLQIPSLGDDSQNKGDKIMELEMEVESLKSEIDRMVSESQALIGRRDAQFAKYEKLLQAKDDEVRREKQERSRLQDFLLKRTPTPSKMEPDVALSGRTLEAGDENKRPAAGCSKGKKTADKQVEQVTGSKDERHKPRRKKLFPLNLQTEEPPTEPSSSADDVDDYRLVNDPVSHVRRFLRNRKV